MTHLKTALKLAAEEVEELRIRLRLNSADRTKLCGFLAAARTRRDELRALIKAGRSAYGGKSRWSAEEDAAEGGNVQSSTR